MIYWVLSDMAGAHARRHDGDWEPLAKKSPCGDEVERFHRHRDAVAAAAKLRKKGCHVKPLKQEGIVYYWRLPEAAGESDLAEVIEFRSARQAAAWKKQALAEGCEVIECMGVAEKAPRPRKHRATKR